MIIEDEIEYILMQNVKDIGFECDEKYCDFLNSEDGQTLEWMYKLVLDL